MRLVRFIPDIDPIRVVGALSETMDWGQSFMGVDAYRKNSGSSGSGVKMAILDTGIDPNHQDLKPNLMGSVDFTGDNRKLHGHGSHVAGIAGAKANGTGVIGVAPDCSLYSVRVLDSNGLCPGDYSWIIRGIEWCIENGMDIINMSLGSPENPPDELRTIVSKAVNSGIIIVSAAGNEGRKDLNWPARFPEVISVAALTKDGKIANFSNTSDDIKVAAPGCDIYSCWTDGGYAVESGSSMSSPFVAGIIALMISYHRDGGDHESPLASWQDAIDHLNRFANPGNLVTQDGDPVNIGMLDFNKAMIQRINESCNDQAVMSGVPLWRVKIYEWFHSLIKKLVL